MTKSYALTKTLRFESGEDRKFARLVNLFVTGGNVLHFNPQSGPTSRSREERKLEARIVRAYKAISYPIDDQQNAVVEGEGSGGRKLNAAGGAMTLEISEFKLLEKYLVAAPANTLESDVVEEVLEWVESLPADKSE